jgi:hypothetical protein
MTSSEISDIEQMLSLCFPSGVHTFLGNISKLPSQALQEGDVLQDPKAVLELNTRLRAEGFYHLKWPPEFFAIGSDPGGCIYFFDLRVPQASVFFADYNYDDISDFKKLSATPEEFVIYVREMVRDWEEQERRIPPAPSAGNILAVAQGDSKRLVQKIVALSSQSELVRWWLDEVGWNADEQTIDAAISRRLEFLRRRAKENGWEIEE